MENSLTNLERMRWEGGEAVSSAKAQANADRLAGGEIGQAHRKRLSFSSKERIRPVWSRAQSYTAFLNPQSSNDNEASFLRRSDELFPPSRFQSLLVVIIVVGATVGEDSAVSFCFFVGTACVSFCELMSGGFSVVFSSSGYRKSMEGIESTNYELLSRIAQLEHERDALQKDIEQLCMQQAGPAYLVVATRMHFQRFEVLTRNFAEQKAQNDELQRELAKLRESMRLEKESLERELLALTTSNLALQEYENQVVALRTSNLVLHDKLCEYHLEDAVHKGLKVLHQVHSEMRNEVVALLEEWRTVISSVVCFFQEKFQSNVHRQSSRPECDEPECKDVHITTCADVCNTPKEVISPSIIVCSKGSDDEHKALAQAMQEKLASSLAIAQAIVVYKGLYGHVDGTTPAPPKFVNREVKRIVVGNEAAGSMTGAEVRIEYETVDNPEHELWMAHDQSLVAYITSTLSEEVLGSIDDDLTALELWTTLATTYSQVSEARFLQLKRQFQDIKRGTRSVLEYLNEIKNVSDQLAAIRHPVSDKDKESGMWTLGQQLMLLVRQVTNEKVKALVELAQLRHEFQQLQETIRDGHRQGHAFDKEGKIRSMFRRSYLKQWIGLSDGQGNSTVTNANNRDNRSSTTSSYSLDLAILPRGPSMHVSIYNGPDSMRNVKALEVEVSKMDSGSLENLDGIIFEANLIKTALGSSLPVSWSAEAENGSPNGPAADDLGANDDVDCVSAAGFEMVELLLVAAQLKKASLDQKNLTGSLTI
ncbi:hypothetical protein EJ110_NYTH12068 [Nymphaea thermarum]|nr:hypothetical protein EJ110_NYTH12068 [Nymphaea thermarum]